MGEHWILAIDLGNGGPKVASVSLGADLPATALRCLSVQIGQHGSSHAGYVGMGAATAGGGGRPAGDAGHRGRIGARDRDHPAMGFDGSNRPSHGGPRVCWASSPGGGWPEVPVDRVFQPGDTDREEFQRLLATYRRRYGTLKSTHRRLNPRP